MLTVQTSFDTDYVVGKPGALSDNGLHDTVSKIAAATVPFGTFVSRRATPADPVSDCGNPAASADVTARGLGIALKSEYCHNAAGYVQYEGVLILRKGRVYVTVEDAVTAGQTLFVRFAAGTGTQLGAFRSDADTATAVACPGVVARDTTTAGGLCHVEINLPQ